MRRILSLLIAAAVLLGSMGSVSVFAEETQQTFGYDNLNNDAGELKVAFLGGSITYGGGDTANRLKERYSSLLVNDYFKQKFPNKTVTEINAGIGGTPSEYGVFRTAKDVSAFAPDVVFVEFAVNDSGYALTTDGQALIKANMEGIVRQLTSLPKVPVIIFLYTHRSESSNYSVDGAIAAHQQIAEYYGIGTVNLHDYVKAEEEKGNIAWSDLSGDGVHPNTTGYAYYADYIEKCFNKSYSSYFKKPRMRKTPLMSEEMTFGNPHAVEYTDESIQYTGTWTASPELDYLSGYDWVKYPENLNGTFVQAQNDGETVTFTATCRSLGLAYGNVLNGNKAVRWIIDEGTPEEKRGTINGYTNGIRYYMCYAKLARGMEYKEHTLKLINEVSAEAGEENNTNFAFSHILVDDELPVIEPDEGLQYDDYVANGAKPANLIPQDQESSARYFVSSGRNTPSVTTATLDDWSAVSKTRVAATIEAASDITERAESVFCGKTVDLKTPLTAKNYVIGMRVKKLTDEDARIGASLNNDSTVSVSVGKVYGKTGMTLSDEYSDYKDTIVLSDGYDSTKAKQYLTVGLPEGVKQGAKAAIDTSTPDAVYLAEEVPYDMTNTLVSESDRIITGTSAIFKAEVLNQIGICGNLSQNFTWYVMNEDKSEMAEGFAIEQNGAEATVSASESVPAGVYSVVAVSNDYDKMIKTQKITVTDRSVFQDWEKSAMPENIIPETKGSRARTVASASRNDLSVTLSVASSDTGEWSYGSPNYITIEAINDIASERAVSCFTGITVKMGTGVIDKSKTYVVKMDIKGLSDTAASAGVSLNNDNAASVSLTNEYQRNGMPLAFDEYKTIAATITPSGSFDSAKENIMTVGFPAGTKKGAKFMIDTSTPDAVYLAEEIPYDIGLVKTSGAEKLFRAESFEFKAEAVNQIGTVGTLAQNFTWYAMTKDRTGVADGIIVTPSEDTRTATVRIDDTAASGEYDIVAVSDDYSMAKGVSIRVVAGDYYIDHVPSAKNGNIYTEVTPADNAYRIFSQCFARSVGTVTKTEVVDDNGAAAFDVAVDADMQTTAINPVMGFISTKVYGGSTTPWQQNFDGFKKGKSYVFKIRAKDIAQIPYEPPKINIALHNETSDLTSIAYSDQYNSKNDGMELGREYSDFIVTITPAENYNESSEKQYLSFGFVNGTVKGTKIRIDVSDDDGIYLAEEQVYDINTKVCSGDNVVNAGSSLTLAAEVVNQLGVVGSLSQSFEWAAMDTERSEFVDGITVTPSADTKMAVVTVSDTVAEGEYDIVAVSKDYDIVKGARIKVVPISEMVSELEIVEDSGYVELKAAVSDSKAEEVVFTLAQYDAENRFVDAVSETVKVKNGSAETDIYFDDALANGTKVKAFVWDKELMRPIANSKGFITEITVTTAE